MKEQSLILKLICLSFYFKQIVFALAINTHSSTNQFNRNKVIIYVFLYKLISSSSVAEKSIFIYKIHYISLFIRFCQMIKEKKLQLMCRNAELNIKSLLIFFFLQRNNFYMSQKFF